MDLKYIVARRNCVGDSIMLCLDKKGRGIWHRILLHEFQIALVIVLGHCDSVKLRNTIACQGENGILQPYSLGNFSISVGEWGSQ